MSFKTGLQDSQGREVTDITISGRDEDDLGIDSAVYIDTGGDVPDDELDYLEQTYPEYMYEQWVQNQVMRAESLLEGDR